ncbi:hypothetical protein F5Y07DRAFT_264186 [Xylaria sp. FL0933]|nr:hypothetical protein F5Y07DRAFT_264186 [Xylaria sp. FL0933]
MGPPLHNVDSPAQNDDGSDQTVEGLKKEIGGLNTRLDSLEARSTRVEGILSVLVSALKEKAAKSSNYELMPLRSYHTHQPIEGFPRTVADFYTLDDQTMDRMFADLYERPPSDKTHKRRDLMILCGIVDRDILDSVEEYDRKKAEQETSNGS